MKWQDRGIIVSIKKYGESSLILNLLTEFHGLHAGLVRNSISKKNRNIYQIGNICNVEWTGRLEEQLGYYKSETENSISHNIINNSLKIDLLMSISTLISVFLADRQVNSTLFIETLNLINYLNNRGKYWLSNYIKWELILLSELGFGLDLKVCAVTGLKDDLSYVSPKSGRAVSKKGAGKWKNKLFLLPNFITKDNENTEDKNELINAIKITTFFLNRYGASIGLKLPDVRDRFTNKLDILESYN
ncbi:MAG: DNA repair protein RecO [Pelagibacterales bacterium]|nr:DNA repair protein RecO [Pelagibacterales bacterium]RCL81499.1 MAG: DNA repair protein RecO [Alphaproteobacteria bacterium]|tara:strand:+ start:2350 stop:3087 length:738 start_codon:yes stop_codon:yes gene_type:complete